MADQPVPPFRADERYDLEQANDGRSRFGSYLAQHREKFLDLDGDPTRDRLEFAAAAWTVAAGPVMSPPFVRGHPRIQSALVFWDEQGGLAVNVVVALPGAWLGRPRQRAVSWDVDRVWGTWYDPRDATRLTVLPSVLVRVPIAPGDVTLPAFEHGNPEVTAAKNAVLAVVTLLNAVVADVLALPA